MTLLLFVGTKEIVFECYDPIVTRRQVKSSLSPLRLYFTVILILILILNSLCSSTYIKTTIPSPFVAGGTNGAGDLNNLLTILETIARGIAPPAEPQRTRTPLV